MIATFHRKFTIKVMVDKAIQLIKTRIQRLESEDFDLEAWKSGTTSVLKRFLPASDPRIKDIDELKIDYSSWALRDSNSKYNPIETCKKKGKSILEALVDEIEVMGLENLGQGTDPFQLVAAELQDIDAEKIKDPQERSKALKALKKEQLMVIIEKLLY